MVDYVLGFAFDEEKQNVLLIKKTKPDWQKGFFNGIGGKIEAGETSLEAMIREFKEECDINTDVNDWRTYGTLQCKGFSIVCYKAFINLDRLKEHKTMTEEMVIMFGVDVIRESSNNSIPLISNVRWLIEAALDDNDGHGFDITAQYESNQ